MSLVLTAFKMSSMSYFRPSVFKIGKTHMDNGYSSFHYMKQLMRNENLFLRDYKKDQIKKDLRELLKRSKHDGIEKRLEIADEMKSQILPRLDDPKIDISEADGDIIKDSLSVYRDIQAYDLMVIQASKTFLASTGLLRSG